MHYLVTSERRYCEMDAFVRVWKGWGKELINPREQQDANENFQILLDQFFLRHCNACFVTNSLDSLDGKLHQDIKEHFFSIGLIVKTTPGLLNTLEAFSARELLVDDNQYTIRKEDKLYTTKQQRLTNISPILVFHLKRFEYDAVTHARSKRDFRPQRCHSPHW
jgi:hypothetical protein